ncbi:MOP flippase family protein [Vibrio cyclitrophicus]
MSDLIKKAKNGIKWTALSSSVLATLQIVQISILTNYLDSSAFGMMAIVFVIIGFSSLFMDLGLSSAIISYKKITDEQLSTLYWLNIISGLTLSFVIYSSALYISEFYNEPQIEGIIKLLSITFIFSSLGSQYKYINQKEMKFNLIAKLEIISSVLSFLTTILLAINDYGVYSLVAGVIVQSIFSNVAFFSMTFKYYKLSFVIKLPSVMPMIKFGFYQMGEKCVNYFNSQLDVIIIGKLMGPEILGFYSVSKNLVMKPAAMINPIVTKVGFPIMASIQDDTLKLKAIYLNTINYLTAINAIVYGSVIVLAEPIVLILFGDKWLDTILIIQILSLYFMLRSITNPVGSLQLAKGRADLGFYWNLFVLLITPMTIYLGSSSGIIGITISLVLSQLILNIPCWRFLIFPLCKAKFSEYASVIFNGIIFSAKVMSPSAVLYFILVDKFSFYITSLCYSIAIIIMFFVVLKRSNKDLYKLLTFNIRKVR